MANRWINTRTLRAAAGFAFKPNIARSLSPYAQSYHNIRWLVTQIFMSLKLIERSHPFARKNSAHNPRLRDVIALAWSKLSWRNPLKTENVVVLSVTLILATGGLALIGFVGSATLGLGQAQAQMFVPPSPTTDLGMKYLADAFGVDTAGHSAGANLLVTAFKAMMATYSSAMLVIAGFIVLYIVLTAIAGTATDGRFGGSGFNTVWAPLRLIVAIGLLVPLGAGGYNSGQFIALKVAEWGSGLASNAWTVLGNSLTNKGNNEKLIADVQGPALADAVTGTFASEVCMMLGNMTVADSSVPNGLTNTIRVVTKNNATIVGGKGNNNVTILYADSTGNPVCGGIVIPQMPASPSAKSAAAKQIATMQLAAYNHMVSDLKSTIITPISLNSKKYFDPSGSLVDEFIGTDFAGKFQSVINKYQREVGAGIAGAQPVASAAAQAAMSAAIQNQGWAGAASWFNTIARLNAEFYDRAKSVPSIIGVTAGSVSAADTNGRALAAYASAQKFAQLSGQRAVASGTAIAASGNAPATTAGLTSISIGSPNASSIINDLLNKITPVNGFGPDATLSQSNPLADLSNIGNTMFAYAGTLIAASAFFGGASAVLEGLTQQPGLGILLGGATGFGAGMTSTVSTLCLVAATAMMVPAVMLTFMLPLIPFIRFMFGVLNWIFNVLECVIAIPLFALAHLSKGGDGFMTGAAHAGYTLLLAVFIRPTLMIVAFGVAMAMFSLGIGILNDTWSSAVTGWTGTDSATMNVVSIIVYTIIYTIIAYAMCNACFRLLEEIPDSAMRWIGGANFKSSSADEAAVSGAMRSTTGAVLGAQLLGAGSRLGSAPVQGGLSARNADKAQADKNAANLEKRLAPYREDQRDTALAGKIAGAMGAGAGAAAASGNNSSANNTSPDVYANKGDEMAKHSDGSSSSIILDGGGYRSTRG